MARCALLLAHKCRLITGASCVLKNTACTLKAHRGDKQIQRKDSDPRYCHTPRSPASVHCVYRKGQSLTNWIFLPPPRSVNFHIAGSTYSKSLGVENKCCSWKVLSLNDNTQTQRALQANAGWFCSVKSHQIHARLSCSWCQRADLTELNYSF